MEIVVNENEGEGSKTWRIENGRTENPDNRKSGEKAASIVM